MLIKAALRCAAEAFEHVRPMIAPVSRNAKSRPSSITA